MTRQSYLQSQHLPADLVPETAAGRVFALAFVIRLLALPVTIIGLNPYNQHDAVRFDMYARWIVNGHVEHWSPMNVYHLWSGILSPFYLLPGPSEVYAIIFVATLGAASIYFVFCIVETLASQRAALIASLPLIFFPSSIFIHTSLIREAGVLFLHTFITYLFIVPGSRLTTGRRWALTAVALIPLTLLRKEHLPVYLVILGLGVVLHEIDRRNIDQSDLSDIPQRTLAAVTAVGLAILLPVLWFATQKVITLVAQNRAGRSFGNSVYLPNFVPNTLPLVIGFAPIGVAYFYYAPFPWMIDGLRFIPVFIEGVLNIGLTVAAIVGARRLLWKNPVIVIPLLVGFLMFSIFYGLVEANVGAAVRHRQQFIWLLYLFAGVEISTRLQTSHKSLPDLNEHLISYAEKIRARI